LPSAIAEKVFEGAVVFDHKMANYLMWTQQVFQLLAHSNRKHDSYDSMGSSFGLLPKLELKKG
jgi:hypothetical protein